MSYDSWKTTNPDDENLGPHFVQVLCGCGWGHLQLEVNEIPNACPVCGAPIGEEVEDDG